MDPNAVLSRLRTLLGGDHSGYQVSPDGNSIRHEDGCVDSSQPDEKSTDDLLALLVEAEESFQALDSWLKRHGFLPVSWSRAR